MLPVPGAVLARAASRGSVPTFLSCHQEPRHPQSGPRASSGFCLTWSLAGDSLSPDPRPPTPGLRNQNGDFQRDLQMMCVHLEVGEALSCAVVCTTVHEHTHMHVHARTHTCTRRCTRVYTDAHAHTHTQVHTCVYADAHAHTGAHTCVCRRARTHRCTHPCPGQHWAEHRSVARAACQSRRCPTFSPKES